MSKRYPDDLTNEEWVLIEPLLPKGPRGQGRKPKYTRREMLNAMFYVLRTGCSWRHIPTDFPPWKSVYDLFRRYKIRGVFEKIHHQLRRGLRQLAKRAAEPSVGIVDSQSVKTTEKGGFADLMGARRLKVGKDTYWLITLD
jgi:transposase